jgi:hypothetical protein
MAYISDSVCNPFTDKASCQITDTYCQPSFKLVGKTNVTGYHRAVPWLRWLAAGFSQRRLVFAPWSFHVGFVVDKVSLGQVRLRVLWFSPVRIIPPGLHTHISSGPKTMCPLLAADRRHSLTSCNWFPSSCLTSLHTTCSTSSHFLHRLIVFYLEEDYWCPYSEL